MKIIGIIALVAGTIITLLIGTASFAQNSKLVSIYNQIPVPQDRIKCEDPESYDRDLEILGSLSTQLNELRIQLEEEQAISSEKKNKTLAAGFPTAEELASVEKLPESEQRAFWKKMEDDQAKMKKDIASKSMKYQAEKESLTKKIGEYKNQSPEEFQEYFEVFNKAGEVKLAKIEKIESNPSAKNSPQQIEEICVEFCSTVTPYLLKRVRYEYANLKQNMSLHRRLSIIDLAIYSTLTEEEVIEQNAALLDLNDLEFLAQFINNYRSMFEVLPGAYYNQR